MTYRCRPKSKKGPSFPVEMEYIKNGWVSVATICNEKLYVTPQYVSNSEEFNIESDGTTLFFTWKPSDIYWTFVEVKINDGPWQFWVPEDWGGDTPGSSEWSMDIAYYGAVVGDTIRARMRFGDAWDFPNQFSKVYAVDSLIVPGVPDVEGLTISTGGRTVKFKWTPNDYAVLAQYKFNDDDWVDLDPIDGNDGVSFFNSSDQTGDRIQVRLKYTDDPYESVNWVTSDVATITAPFLLFIGTSEPNFSNFINSISTNTELGFSADGNNIFVDNPAGIVGMELTNQHGDLAGSFDFSFCHNLEYCYLYVNNIISADLSDCINVEDVEFGGNPLTEINVSGCINLNNFSAYDTQLVELDVSGNINLNYCDVDSISTLTSILATGVTGDGGKAYLDLWNCNLDEIALNNFFESLGDAYDTEKSYIGIGNNPGSLLCNPKIATDKGWTVDGGPTLIFAGSDTVDINDFINGTTTSSEVSFVQWGNNIYVDNIDPITALDLSGSGISGEMYLEDNNLITLDLHGLTGLTILNCSHGDLTSIDITGCSGLENLNCNNNDLDALILTGCTALTYIDCGNNILETLEIPDCPLVYLLCYNNEIDELDLSNLELLEECNIGGCGMSTLTLTGCTSLSLLDANNNAFTTLNFTGLSALETLYIQSCSSLTAITLTGCSSILYITVNGSPNLNSLGFSDIKDTIRGLLVDGCAFTSIDLSDATALYEFNASNNNLLTTVDLSGCTALVNLWAYSTGLTSLDVSGDSLLNLVYLPNSSLTNTAIDTIFTALPTKSGTINIADCPGAGTCTQSIATDKGWAVQI